MILLKCLKYSSGISYALILKCVLLDQWLANSLGIRLLTEGQRLILQVQCLYLSKVEELLIELHKRVCGSQVGKHTLAHRAMIQGFQWPQMHKDAAEYVRKCEQCQKHAHLIHQSVGNLNPISSPQPFMQWGLDIIGPLPWATGNRRFVLVAVDYFTKQAEAEALANIQDVDIKKFVWKNIVTRFGVLESLVADNGLQFDSQAF